ncbi:hypothetical protein G6F56_006474 [Rhizopus delemar]|nr:hypothetical protein G6F56_006474 [Rhizopus delemar]
MKQLEKENNQLREDTKNRELELTQSMDENTKLMEIIDKQKFDLDEARSGHNPFYSNGKEQSELEAECIDKLNQARREQEVLKNQVEADEAQIRFLMLQLDQHHKITNDIKTHINIAHAILHHPFIRYLSYISWLYLFYHLILFILATFNIQTPLDPLLKAMDLYLHYHYMKT